MAGKDPQALLFHRLVTGADAAWPEIYRAETIPAAMKGDRTQNRSILVAGAPMLEVRAFADTSGGAVTATLDVFMWPGRGRGVLAGSYLYTFALGGWRHLCVTAPVELPGRPGQMPAATEIRGGAQDPVIEASDVAVAPAAAGNYYHAFDVADGSGADRGPAWVTLSTHGNDRAWVFVRALVGVSSLLIATRLIANRGTFNHVVAVATGW